MSEFAAGPRPDPRPIRSMRLFRIARFSLLIVACGAFALACGGEKSDDASAQSSGSASAAESADSSQSSTASSNASSDDAHGKSQPPRKPDAEKAARHPSERPLPGFEGRTLSGTRVSVSELIGTRLLLFIFNPEVETAAPVAEAVNRIAATADDNNFKVLGVGVGSHSAALTRFVREGGIEFPILDDSDGTITQKLRLRSPTALLGVDAEGYVTFGIAHFATEGDVASLVEAELRRQLRVSDDSVSTDGALLVYRKAPSLGVKSMGSGETLETSDLAGRAAIVIFFLHTCPHCHKALASIKTTLAGIEEEKRPRLVAISLQNSPSAIRRSMEELDLDFFDPYLDPGQAATDRWGVTGGVPSIFVVDPQGQIRHTSSGWNEQRDGGMLRMQASRAAGAEVPMLLDATGYSGSSVCGVCHEQEYATWEYTKHATAFDTLVTHAADRRTDCVGCHVVGFEEKGGFDVSRRPPHLEDVGCESCHGRGGPHLSPAFVPGGDYAQVCGTCLNATHSLGFDYEEFHPRVSHKRIAALSNTERGALLGDAGPDRSLSATPADFVGSTACQSCHEAEFKTWEASPHAHAVATLEKQDKASDPACLACHTTGYGKTGGFVPETAVSTSPDLARVGCESCHGAGSNHVGENAERVGTILSLGDKCDSCVILKICGSCHDKENDPRFEFEVEKRIDAQRHGTIDSAATRAGEQASLAPLHSRRSRLHADDFHGSFQKGAAHDVAAARSPHGNREATDRKLLEAAFHRIEQQAGPASDGARFSSNADPS